MSESTLCLHSGGTLVSREDVFNAPCPAGTDTWFPQPHGAVLGVVEEALTDAGFTTSKAQYGLSHNGLRFFSTIDLNSTLVPGVSLAVGVRNSNDKSFPIGLIGGSRVFVCDNLAFSSNIYVSKRHTLNGRDRFDEGLALAILGLDDYRHNETKRLACYQETQITDDQAKVAIVNAYEKGVIPVAKIADVLKEWREPSHPEFAERTVWSLMNGLTEILKPTQSNPQKFASRTMKLYGLMDSICGFTMPVAAI